MRLGPRREAEKYKETGEVSDKVHAEGSVRLGLEDQHGFGYPEPPMHLFPLIYPLKNPETRRFTRSEAPLIVPRP